MNARDLYYALGKVPGDTPVYMEINNEHANILSFEIVHNPKKSEDSIFLSNKAQKKKKKIKAPPSKKYIVVGGRVSQRGRTFYFNAWELCRMYKIKPEQCFFVESGETDAKKTLKSLRKLYPKLPLLSPRADGIYTKPK